MHRLSVVSAVRCLACGTVYTKPEGLGTAESNPGCPKCGYVGWVPDKAVREDQAQSRFDADRPPRHFRQSG
jgi:predicted  nucleic acid-binding Zn-ribbon protein